MAKKIDDVNGGGGGAPRGSDSGKTLKIAGFVIAFVVVLAIVVSL